MFFLGVAGEPSPGTITPPARGVRVHLTEAQWGILEPLIPKPRRTDFPPGGPSRGARPRADQLLLQGGLAKLMKAQPPARHTDSHGDVKAL